ncbi:hypothetical protein OE88DRAFT_759356 [Heliocybe sulcata]|uniref:Uncharacterized protein n=1 Tax=Heliocybe sulcata TaxID=5364 RepID=A0A5C3MS86_9AGAM|nr:hypothetical protein OE88DRAFT_759356 [Heliocybe sulcata]
MSFPPDKAYLVGFALEALLYGLYFGAFATSIAFLGWRRKTTDVNWIMLTSSCLLFVAATVHLGISFDNVLAIFVTSRDAIEGPSTLVNMTYYQVKSISTMYVCDILGDLVLLYRCWLVWEKRFLAVLLPTSSLCALTATSVLSSVELAREPTNTNVFASRVGIFAEASLLLSLVTNLSITLLISGRIYYMARRLQRAQKRRYGMVIAMVVESGAIFTAAQIALVVMFSLHSQKIWVMTNSVPQIYCLAPTLIIVRVGLGRSSSGTGSKQERSSSSSLRLSKDLAFARPDQLSSVTDDRPLSTESITGNRSEGYTLASLV